MDSKQGKILGSDDNAIPELDDGSHPTFSERIRRIERNIANAFTVERDTSLAEGAGAPGSTSVGGSSKQRNRT
jgi:hypothetical protein